MGRERRAGNERRKDAWSERDSDRGTEAPAEERDSSSRYSSSRASSSEARRSAIARSASEGIAKPSIVRVLAALAPHVEELDDSAHGWKALRCPFHDDRAASASYSTDKERFRCHGCGVSGDGYDLIQEILRCDFATARAKAEEMVGNAFSSPTSTDDTFTRPSKLTARRNAARAKIIRKTFKRHRLQSRYGNLLRGSATETVL